jgi:hypothetical protein
MEKKMNRINPIRHIFAFLSFVIPTLVIGFIYKFGIFGSNYALLGMYRDDISMIFAFGSLIVQGIFWAYIYVKLLAREKFLYGAVKLFLLAFPIGLSFNVFVIGAKHVMTSVYQFAILEIGFTLLMYAVVCPLIALSYSFKKQNTKKNLNR